ncbi:MAG: hypothetical protein VYD54_00940 [Bdellovibrionota bacterium]|nr:hypothetical protein [Bdellovibrionota bacterium]
MKYFILFIFLYSQMSFSEEKNCSCLEQQKTKSPGKKYRGNISLGIETIGEGTRSDPGILLKAYLSGGGLLKYSSSFALVNANNYLQGEFSLGGQFYPLNSFSESFIQPFFYLEAVLGVGAYKKVTRTDAGHNIGVGLDVSLYKRYGISLIVESHQAAENSLRIIFGIFKN